MPKQKNKNRIKIALKLVWLTFAIALLSYIFLRCSEAWRTKTLYYLLKLALTIAGACFIGAIFEYRNWIKTASFLAMPLIRIGKLPNICGISFLTALCSNNAANSLLAGAYGDGKISRREMILGAIANSYPAKVSHSLRIMFPVVAALGLPGILYFVINFSTGLLRTCLILLLSRGKALPPSADTEESNSDISLKKTAPLPWKETLVKSFFRTRNLLLRVCLITVPAFVAVSYFVSTGGVERVKNIVPESLMPYLSPEIIMVMTARLGGFLSASAVAHDFLTHGTISVPEILIALFAGNVITNPIRSVRRNLPSAVGIFPGLDGAWIVLILQSCRLIAAIVVIFILLMFIK